MKNDDTESIVLEPNQQNISLKAASKLRIQDPQVDRRKIRWHRVTMKPSGSTSHFFSLIHF